MALDLKTSLVLCASVACLGMPAGALAAGPPRSVSLDGVWEVRDLAAPPAAPQPAPPQEGPEATPGPRPLVLRASQVESGWRAVRVPSVFDPDARPELFGGTVKQYRLRFRGPVAKGFAWAFRFEQSRRRTTVFLNGRRVGLSIDPYTPFEVPATGLRAGRSNTLEVQVDSRKDPRVPEGWWNWGGIVRPVTLVPRGRVAVTNLGLLSDVSCRRPGRACKARVLLDGMLSKLPPDRTPRKPRRGRKGRPAPALQPVLRLSLRSPTGKVTTKRFSLRGSRRGPRRLRDLSLSVPGPMLWSPERPALYKAKVTVGYAGKTWQVAHKQIGLRSVKVKRGLLYLNNRQINVRGASMHEDTPGHGAAITGADMDEMVQNLKEIGANVTRAHYVLSEALLQRLDRAGIMVWNQAPIWQRDHGANLLGYPLDRARAVAQVRRTVLAARNHPSVITHSVANELAFAPDGNPSTRTFLISASETARDIDPTLPIALDVKAGTGYSEQFTYQSFDIIGINQYFGWYTSVADFATLEPYLREMRDNYPDHALVMTEFGAEGRPDMAGRPATEKGSYGFQTDHVARTLGVVDRLPFLSGAIHWTLREFEIYPGWGGGAPPGPGRNTRHHKGVLTYAGEKKPAWDVLHDNFIRTPLYR
ncbi:MAG: glycoside hydrolase family 2 protein [Thermoleophilaceae bacterium]